MGNSNNRSNHVKNLSYISPTMYTHKNKEHNVIEYTIREGENLNGIKKTSAHLSTSDDIDHAKVAYALSICKKFNSNMMRHMVINMIVL